MGGRGVSSRPLKAAFFMPVLATIWTAGHPRLAKRRMRACKTSGSPHRCDRPALAASVISIRVAISVALIEIIVGAVAGNVIGLEITPWVNFLAGFGAIMLTFLAGTEIDAKVVRKNLGPSVGIGIASFLAPYLGVLIYARYVIGWTWPEAQIAGISMSTTSVAVVYAVMVETGFNKTELGKIILAACFITDLGTVLALGIVFAHFDIWLALFGAATAVVLWLLPKFAPWFFDKVGIASANLKQNSYRLSCCRSEGSLRSPAARRYSPPILSAWRWRPFA